MTETKPGTFYRHTPGGLIEVPGQDHTPDVWICRRVADFPRGLPPANAATGVCTRCQAPIAYNPGRVAAVPLSTPQVCMQCAGIQPLPIEP